MDLVPRIYHETQEADSQMCGQHALNNLLQNSYFQPTDLAEIATQLDDEENATLDEDRKSSENMDDSGFFSVQVLDRCIQIWNLSLARWRSEEFADSWDKPEEEEAFILNLSSHWFCLRRFGRSSSRWYNLNSFFPTPQWISDTYLSMVIKSAEDEGYSVFVIRPLSAPSAAAVAAGESILPNATADEVAASLGPPNQTSSSSTSFRGSGQTLGGAGSGGGFSGAAGHGDFEDEDAALQRALQASLEDSTPGSPLEASPRGEPEADDPVALSLARSQARLQAFQREQAAALRGDYDMAADYPIGGYTGYAAAVANGSGSASSSIRGGLGSRGSSRSGNVPLVDARTEEGGSRRSRRQGDPSALPSARDDLASAPSGSSTAPSNPARQRSRHDEDEEQMRIAIEASMREAKQRERAQARETRRANADAESGMDVDDEDEDQDEDDDEPLDQEDDEELETYSASPSPPPGLQPAPVPASAPAMAFDFADAFASASSNDPPHGAQGRSLLSGDRHLDDEDAELQRALAASMEGIPEGWQIPASPPPAPKPAARPAPPPVAEPSRSLSTGEGARAGSSSKGKPAAASDGEDESDDDGVGEEKEEVLSPDEIRRRRLARFGRCWSGPLWIAFRIVRLSTAINALDLDFTLTKAERLQLGDSAMDHAMVITAVLSAT